MRARDVARQCGSSVCPERDHRERAAVETDRARDRDSGSEKQDDQEAHARPVKVRNGDDHIAIDHRGSDHGAQDHRQGRLPRSCPSSRPRRLAAGPHESGGRYRE